MQKSPISSHARAEVRNELLWSKDMSVTNVLVKRQVPTSHQFKNEIIPALQSPLGPATILSGQRQATDRLGSESVTTQVWLEEHGFPMTQGFWHSCLMQASFEGQSASTLHSGSGSGSYAAQKEKKDWINGTENPWQDWTHGQSSARESRQSSAFYGLLHRMSHNKLFVSSRL